VLSRQSAARRRARPAATVALATVLVTVVALPARAEPEPVYPSQEQVERAQSAVGDTAAAVAALDGRYAAATARLASVQRQAATAAEAYNGARLELQRRAAEASAAQRRAAQAQEKAEAAQLTVRQYAAAVYQQGGVLGDLEIFLSSNGPQDVIDRASVLEVIADARSRALEEASATAVVAETMGRQAARARSQQEQAAHQAEQARDSAAQQAQSAAADSAAIERQQQQVVSQLAELRQTSVALERQRQDGLRAAAEARAAAAAAAEQARLAEERARSTRDEAARRAADAAARDARRRAAEEAEAARQAEEAARRAAERREASQPAPTKPAPAKPEPAQPAPPPPSSGGVSAVIAYARAQVGKPYKWGGEGPDSFDCSGLTMMAWRQAGVNLSHFTGAQWAETSRVAIADLRPGDLVFYGDSGPTSHHMGLYIGGGRMIEAPYTGTHVREASIYRPDLLPQGGRVR
jgi:cell wall-associated NlpC family hydrolase